MGPLGETQLVNLVPTLHQNDSKLKVGIVRALALANIHSPSIDFVIELLFKCAK